MQAPNNIVDCAIIGGGLAGLCLSIQLANVGLNVLLIEKNEYPFHKVCGEYISMESWDFLIELGLPLGKMDLPIINELGISSEKGFMLNAPLQMGGFGISRYTLDEALSKLATLKGVQVLQNTKVNAVTFTSEQVYTITTSVETIFSKMVCGSYGKYTPAFMQKVVDTVKPKRTNFIGVKYHIKTQLKHNRIELHNFKNGYCGISKVDKDWFCLCYLSNATNLHHNNNNIKTMEENVLHRNPFLKRYFTQSEFVSEHPQIISNIQFSKKKTYANGVFLLGDAAGSITPLCGNGMSMGMRASKLLAMELIQFFESKKQKTDIVQHYEKAWSNSFNQRVKTGYYLQNLFGKKLLTHYTLKALSKTPGLMQTIISLTHGQRF
jgi:flavin-dependent dehydrogenase